MESVFVALIPVVIILIGGWMVYDTYNDTAENSARPSEIYYIKGIGSIFFGLYLLGHYTFSLF